MCLYTYVHAQQQGLSHYKTHGSMYMEVLLWTKHDSWLQHQVGKIYIPLSYVCVRVCITIATLKNESLIQCLRRVMLVAVGVPLKEWPTSFCLCRFTALFD